MSHGEKLHTHPRNEDEEARIIASEEFKIDSYFLTQNNLLWLEGRLEELEPECVEIINNVPAYYPTVSELCSLYESRKDSEKFTQMIEYARKHFPGDERFAIMEARFLFAGGDVNGASKILENLASKGCEAPLVLKLLGQVRLSRRMRAEAVEAFQKCLKKYDGYPEVRIDLMRLHYESGNFLDALVESRMIPEGIKNLETKKIEGACLYYKEDFKKALALFTEIYKHHPDDIFVLMYLGDICFRFGKNYLAEYYWSQALAQNPKTLEERAYIARIHLFINEYDQALKVVDSSLKQEPGHYLSIFTMGLIGLCEDKFHQAAENWRRVFEEKRDTFVFEFEMIKKTLKPNKLKEFIFKVVEPEYKPLCDHIKERCSIK